MGCFFIANKLTQAEPDIKLTAYDNGLCVQQAGAGVELKG